MRKSSYIIYCIDHFKAMKMHDMPYFEKLKCWFSSVMQLAFCAASSLIASASVKTQAVTGPTDLKRDTCPQFSLCLEECIAILKYIKCAMF